MKTLFGKFLCWLGLHKWGRESHMKYGEVIEGCKREGCTVTRS